MEEMVRMAPAKSEDSDLSRNDSMHEIVVKSQEYQRKRKERRPHDVLLDLQRGNGRFWMGFAQRPELSAMERRALIIAQVCVLEGLVRFASRSHCHGHGHGSVCVGTGRQGCLGGGGECLLWRCGGGGSWGGGGAKGGVSWGPRVWGPSGLRTLPRTLAGVACDMGAMR